MLSSVFSKSLACWIIALLAASVPAWGAPVDLFYGVSVSATSLPPINLGATVTGVSTVTQGGTLTAAGGSSMGSGTATYGGLGSVTSVSSVGGSSTMQANTTFGFDDVMTANGPPGQLLQYSFNITIDGTMGLVAAQTALTGLGSFASSAFSTVGVSLNAQNEIGLYNLSLSQGICMNTLGCGTSGPGRIVLPAGTVQPVLASLSGILITPPGLVDFSLTMTNDSTAQGALASYVCGSSICFTPLTAGAGADFSSTALLTITALTAGASFTTASGALYGPAPSAVPLPAALPLFASGLVGLLLLGWRRKKKPAAG